MDKRHDTALERLMEQLIESGAENIGTVFARLFELAMQIERERFLGAQHYERSPSRQGYANGYKAKRVDTPAGTITVNVPKTAGHDGEPFYPQSLERGRRSTRAVMLAVAEMYFKGVSTRDVEAVMREFGIESLSSSQVSRAAKLLDEELESWRNRPLGEVKYLILDARYEKMRHDGIVRDVAVLSAIGVGPDERRRILGVSVALIGGRGSLARFSRKPSEPWPARRRIRCLGRPCRSARRTKGCPRGRKMAALPVPPGPERHPPFAQSDHPQAHRRGAQDYLERTDVEGSGNRSV